MFNDLILDKMKKVFESLVSIKNFLVTSRLKIK